MNLLFIIPSLSGGGAERVTVTLASQFCKTDNVSIVTYYEAEHGYELDNNVRIFCLKKSDGGNLLEKLSNSMYRIRQIKEIKKTQNIDVSISMLFSPNMENVLSSGKGKVIISIRNKCSEQLKGFYKKINELVCKHADMVVALSESVRQDQIINFKTPADRIVTIYNPCDYPHIKELCLKGYENYAFDDIRNNTDFLVITAGRLTEQKGHWHLIRAFSRVVKLNSKAKLVILGCGKLENQLKQLSLSLGLQKNVFFMGFHENPYPYLYKADVFAFTSLYEGFGNILLEAMACELPIIACDCDAGPRELLAPDTYIGQKITKAENAKYGILMPLMERTASMNSTEVSTNEAIFANGLINLMLDEKLREYYCDKSRMRIKDFSTTKTVSMWREILER